MSMKKTVKYFTSVFFTSLKSEVPLLFIEARHSRPVRNTTGTAVRLPGGPEDEGQNPPKLGPTVRSRHHEPKIQPMHEDTQLIY